MVVGMNDCPPVEVDGFLVRNAEEIDIGAVDEVALSVGASDPHGCRRAVGDPAEPHLAFAQRLLHAFALVDILYRSEEHTSELQSLMRISYAVFCLKKKM